MAIPCPACANVPDGQAGLVIVGAPLFDDSTGGSNWCLKLCRTCGTLFEWRHEYTFLAGGSEDTTTIDRLGDRRRTSPCCRRA